MTMQPTRIHIVKTDGIDNTLLPRGTESILMVMQVKAQREYAAWTLRERGYNVIEAGDGHEALCLFHSSPDRRIDLVLADATLPRLSGKTLAHKLTAFLSPARLLITAYSATELAVHNAVLNRELNFLQQPATRTALALKVREVLDRVAAEELQFTPAEELDSVAVA